MAKNHKKPTVLIILDGWGVAPPGPGNAITLAKTPTMSALWNEFPHTLLSAHGRAVGLPGDQEGNSEAGHMNLSAGWIVKQDAVYINEGIKDGTFFKNTAFLEALEHLKKYNSKVHLMGLLSNGESAHSFPDHLYAVLDLLHKHEVNKIFLHLFTDGRDSSRFAAIKLLPKLKTHFHNDEKIATIMGRFYAMDRIKKWSRIEAAYNAMTMGHGAAAESAEAAISSAYNRGETDEFIMPTVIVNDHKPLATIDDNDVIIFFNLRSDRAREITKTFVQEDFTEKNPGSFKRKKIAKNIRFVALTDFGPDLPHILTAYPSREIFSALPAVFRDKKQIYIAEAEKYAHVTYFFNGGNADPLYGEERVRIPSPSVAHYEEKPEMSAEKVTAEVRRCIDGGQYDFIAVNFCNPDMIGHTGDLSAGIKAVEAVDACIGKIVRGVFRMDGTAIVTADHGNIEEMINEKSGEIDTEHSINPVPLIIIGPRFKNLKRKKLRGGVLADVAPTILDVMGITTPREMTRKSLLS
ncbi:2,3-bisphosphoglycerate-independent phosphoglycerate mutase [Candidatus Falkowbacteria bacterium]|nr:2,3-bisphosphoglycerate-independent phosphoglycerate mutase [Candidatus Falkowbacteria bacterium]